MTGFASQGGNLLGPLVSPGQGDGGSDFLEINTQTGTTYNLLDSDNCKLITFNNASNITVTLPSGLTSGWHAVLAQLGAGQVILVAGGGVTINEPDGYDRSAKQYAQMDLKNYASETYLLGGYTTGP